MIDQRRREFSFVLLAIGLWLIATPVTYNFCHVAFYNDLTCGALLTLFGLIALINPASIYFIPFLLIGLWLHFAPLLFWYQEIVSYLNDTLIGTVVSTIAFGFLQKSEQQKEEYSPSSWSHRVPTIFIALVCWFLARYLDTYQLGYIDKVWDPFFKNGTEKVLTSSVSRAFPIPDAGLGAYAYFLETLLAWQGGEDRWKNMPWVVLSFGILSLPVGITSIVLIILQPLIVGSWCFICLLIAFLMILIAFLSIKEVIAVLRCIKLQHVQKKSIWKFIVFGDATMELPNR